MLFKQVHPRWASLVVSIWGAAVTGSAYAFGVYSLAIRGNFDLLSSEIDTIGTWQLLGGFFNFVIGGFMDKYGPAMSCRWGGVIQSIFLFLEWAVARKVIAIDSWPVGPTFVLTFFACISQLGNAGVACAVYTTPVKNFPGNSGIVIGIVKAYVLFIRLLSYSTFCHFLFICSLHYNISCSLYMGWSKRWYINTINDFLFTRPILKSECHRFFTSHRRC